MKKKVISVLMATVMVASLLTGCGSSKEAATKDTTAETVVAETTEEETESTQAAEATEEENESTGTADAPECQGALEGVELVVGTSGTYAPFSYFAEDGTTLQGYDVDFLMALQENTSSSFPESNAIKSTSFPVCSIQKSAISAIIQ